MKDKAKGGGGENRRKGGVCRHASSEGEKGIKDLSERLTG